MGDPVKKKRRRKKKNDGRKKGERLPKKTRDRSVRHTPKRFLAAIEDSGGNLRVIAYRLGATYATVHYRLHRKEGKDWDRVREAYERECDAIDTMAEDTLRECIMQRDDINVAERVSRWWLERRQTQRYGRTIKVEGGANPIQVKHTHTHTMVPLEALETLPVAVRLQILEAVEAYEDQQKALTVEAEVK